MKRHDYRKKVVRITGPHVALTVFAIVAWLLIMLCANEPTFEPVWSAYP